jgi:hypothetical protein
MKTFSEILSSALITSATNSSLLLVYRPLQLVLGPLMLHRPPIILTRFLPAHSTLYALFAYPALQEPESRTLSPRSRPSRRSAGPRWTRQAKLARARANKEQSSPRRMLVSSRLWSYVDLPIVLLPPTMLICYTTDVLPSLV